jgi:xanthine dehydrogenase YagT iron-sulfur-binding subunit
MKLARISCLDQDGIGRGQPRESSPAMHNDPAEFNQAGDETADDICNSPINSGTPETRRTFIIKISSAGVAVVLGPDVLAAAAETPAKPEAKSPDAVTLRLRVNGRPIEMTVDPRTTLLDLLRNELMLTGSKKGCDYGQCGACTVLVDGRRINACLTLALTHDGSEVITVEGLANGGDLHPVQAAFLEHDGFQCGYCTPGQICSAVALLHEGHAKSDEEIREWMSGNICRCGAYPNIVAAIRAAQLRS